MKYKNAIKDIDGLTLAQLPDYANNNFWMYGLQIDDKHYPLDREALMQKLSNNKIQTRPVWYPNHLQKPFTECQNFKIKNTLQLVEKTLNIPSSINITDYEIQFVIENLK